VIGEKKKGRGCRFLAMSSRCDRGGATCTFSSARKENLARGGEGRKEGDSSSAVCTERTMSSHFLIERGRKKIRGKNTHRILGKGRRREGGLADILAQHECSPLRKQKKKTRRGKKGIEKRSRQAEHSRKGKKKKRD